jgi:tetrahydromethanopterin S-methyltransferase subunit F
LEIHPFAKAWGLNQNNRLLTIDQRGAILWYLTETLSESTTEFSLEVTSSHNSFLEHVCTDLLIDYGVLSESNSKTRSNEPSKAKIADSAITAILSTNSNEQALGFRTIMALFVPLDFSSQHDSIDRLVSKVRAQSRVVQRLTKLVQGQYSTVIFSLLLFTVVSLLFLVIEPLLQGVFNGIKNINLSDIVLGILVPLLSSFLSFFIDRNEKAVKRRLSKTEKYWQSTIVSNLLKTILVKVPILNQYLGLTRKRSRKVVRKRSTKIAVSVPHIAYTSPRKFSKKRKPRPPVQYTNSADIRKLIRRSFTVNRFQRFIGWNCAREPRTFVSLLLAEGNHEWSEIALAATKRVTINVAREALALIPDSRLSKEMRSKVFYWLCKVEIL